MTIVFKDEEEENDVHDFMTSNLFFKVFIYPEFVDFTKDGKLDHDITVDLNDITLNCRNPIHFPHEGHSEFKILYKPTMGQKSRNLQLNELHGNVVKSFPLSIPDSHYVSVRLTNLQSTKTW